MGAVDRSSDFLAYLQTETQALSVTNNQKRPNITQRDPPQQDARVEQISKEISNGFDTCATDLAHLRQMAKQRKLFEDRTADIQELTYRIKQALHTLSGNVDHLEELCRQPNTSGSPGSQHAAAHRQAILKNLRTRLMDQTREFKDILEVRTNNLRQLETRRGLYGHSQPSRSSGDLGMASSTHASGHSLMRRGQGGASFANPMPVATDPAGPAGLDLEAQQTLTMAPQTTYHQARVDAVEQIQRIVADLSTMFSRVAMMVGQQEELVMRIDSTVDDSLHKLKEGQAHLLRYFQSIVSQRALILKLLGMVLAFGVFFIVFLA